MLVFIVLAERNTSHDAECEAVRVVKISHGRTNLATGTEKPRPCSSKSAVELFVLRNFDR